MTKSSALSLNVNIMFDDDQRFECMTIFAILFSMIFLGQISSAAQYLGGGLIFIAILLHEFPLSWNKLRSVFFVGK
ncbi:hypothetical protein [Xenorhabdus cabanillasii]|uniref:hypothetical protein n=1 Tax=Xenorhabdus cabanillasii TaxID=351673 RepID=UPI000E2492F3|nr:hypothetical protein [Xenorhabdus cabanillasii]